MGLSVSMSISSSVELPLSISISIAGSILKSSNSPAQTADVSNDLINPLEQSQMYYTAQSAFCNAHL
jgi:hypothetical protein